MRKLLYMFIILNIANLNSSELIKEELIKKFRHEEEILKQILDQEFCSLTIEEKTEFKKFSPQFRLLIKDWINNCKTKFLQNSLNVENVKELTEPMMKSTNNIQSEKIKNILNKMSKFLDNRLREIILFFQIQNNNI